MEKQKRTLFDRLFRRQSSTQTTFANLPIDMRCELAGFMATRAINSPEVLTVVNTIAEIFSTIPTYHKRTDDTGNVEYLEKDIHRVLNIDPNPLQNRTQFWISVVTQWLLNNNVIILPEWDRRYDERTGRAVYTLRSLAPLPHTTAKPQRDGNGKYYIDISLENGTRRFNVEDLIILNRFSTLNGGGSNQPISLHQSIMQAILKQAETQAISPKTIQAYLQIKQGNMKPEAAEKRRKEVLEQINTKADGELPIVTLQADMELKSIDIKNIPIDKEILEYAKKGAYNFFGFTDDALQRKLSDFEWQLLIATTFTPMSNQASQEFGRKLFSPREKEMRNEIEFDLTALQVATLRDKTSFAYQMIPMGVINPDEARERFGYGIRPDRKGSDWQKTLNLVEWGLANDYQMMNASKGRLAINESITTEPGIRD